LSCFPKEKELNKSLQTVLGRRGYLLETARTFSSNPLILFIKPGSPLSLEKLTSIFPLQVHIRRQHLHTACNFHGPRFQGQRASQSPASAFVNLKENISCTCINFRPGYAGAWAVQHLCTPGEVRKEHRAGGRQATAAPLLLFILKTSEWLQELGRGAVQSQGGDLPLSSEQLPRYSALSVGLHPKVCKEELKFCAVSRHEVETMLEPNAQGPETEKEAEPQAGKTM